MTTKLKEKAVQIPSILVGDTPVSPAEVADWLKSRIVGSEGDNRKIPLGDGRILTKPTVKKMAERLTSEQVARKHIGRKSDTPALIRVLVGPLRNEKGIAPQKVAGVIDDILAQVVKDIKLRPSLQAQKEILAAEENESELKKYLDESLTIVKENRVNPQSIVHQLSDTPLTAMCMGVDIRVKGKEGRRTLADIELIGNVVKTMNTLKGPRGLDGFVEWMSNKASENGGGGVADLLLVFTRLVSFLDDNIAFRKFAQQNELSLDGYANLRAGLDKVIQGVESRGGNKQLAGSLRGIKEEAELRFAEIFKKEGNQTYSSAPLPINFVSLCDVAYSWYIKEAPSWKTLSPDQRVAKASYYLFKYLESYDAVTPEQVNAFCDRLGGRLNPDDSWGEIDLAEAVRKKATEAGLLEGDSKTAPYELMERLYRFSPKEFTQQNWADKIGSNDEVEFVVLSMSGAPGHPGHGDYFARSLSAAAKRKEGNSKLKQVFIFAPMPDADNIPHYKKPIDTTGFRLERGITQMVLLGQLVEAFPKEMEDFYHVTYLQPDPRSAKNIVTSIQQVITQAKEKIVRDVELATGGGSNITFAPVVLSVGEDECERDFDGVLKDREHQPRKLEQFKVQVLSRMGHPRWLLEDTNRLLNVCPGIESIGLARGKSFNAKEIRGRLKQKESIRGMVAPGIEEFVSLFWGGEATTIRRRELNGIPPPQRTARRMAEASIRTYLQLLGISPIAISDEKFSVKREANRHKISREWPIDGRLDAQAITSLAVIALMQIERSLNDDTA